MAEASEEGLGLKWAVVPMVVVVVISLNHMHGLTQRRSQALMSI